MLAMSSIVAICKFHTNNLTKKCLVRSVLEITSQIGQTFSAAMKIKVLSRNPDHYRRETIEDVHRLPRNYNPSQHLFQVEREYTRALNATKLDRIFAKPFLTSLSGHFDGVYTMCLHPSSLSTLISGSGEGEIIFWNLATRKNLRMIQAHRGMVNSISCSGNGQLVTTVGGDSTLKHWKFPDQFPELSESDIISQKNDIEPEFMTSVSSPISCIHHQPVKNGNKFATAFGQAVEIWELGRGSASQSYRPGQAIAQYHYAKFNPVHEPLLGCLDSQYNISMFDIRRNYPINHLKLTMRSNALSWNPMEAYVFTVANEDYSLYTFDLRKSNSALYVHKDHILAVMDVDYSPTGQEFVTAGYDKTIRIFSCDKSKSREVYHTRRMQRLHCIKWSLDDRYIISGSEEMNLRLWKARASERLNVLRHRQKDSQAYMSALKEKYKNHPQIKKIDKHRQVPEYVKFHTKQFREIQKSKKRKEANRILHSEPGSVKRVSEKSKSIVKSD